MDLTHLFSQRALGKSGKSGELQRGLGRPWEVWGALDRSGELQIGPGRFGGISGRSGEVLEGPGRSGEVLGLPQTSGLGWQTIKLGPPKPEKAGKKTAKTL